MHLDNKARTQRYTSAGPEIKHFSWLGFLRSSWWMLVFCSGCLGIHAHCMQKKSLDYLDIQEQIKGLHSQRDSLAKIHEDLTLQIHSQNDPNWIELTLKKQLGVVPEGQMKVYFKRDE
ncbi:MAG: hypothetical protein NTZ52_02820 [Chlamydiae bacterium]|nr:hypothetical protein [Chlamydiota bacterium]